MLLSHRLLVPVVFVALVSLALVLGGSSSRAQVVNASRTVHERADATSFVPSPNKVASSPDAGFGYEIVSFSRQVPSQDLTGYSYAELQPPAVRCTTTFEPDGLNLHVSGAYPYAGCVFVGATNAGETNLVVELGPLDSEVEAMCLTPNCDPSHFDLLAGGHTPRPHNSALLPETRSSARSLSASTKRPRGSPRSRSG